MVRKLKKSLSEWQGQGFVTHEQITNIIEYEDSKKKNSLILMGFLSLGVIVLAIGVISLVASNWSSIPDGIKITCDFLVLATLGIYIYRSNLKGNHITSDILITLMSFLYFASIGLISQIYHTGGAFYQAMLLWLIAFFPLLLISKKQIFANLWALFSIITIPLATFSLLDHRTIMTKETAIMINIGIAIAFPLILALLASISKIFESDRLHRSYTFWAMTSGVIFVIFHDAIGSAKIKYRHVLDYQDSVLSLTSLTFIIIHIAFFLYLATVVLKRKSSFSREKILLIILTTLFYLMPMSDLLFSESYRSIYRIFLAPVNTIIMLTTAGIYLLCLDHQKMFNWVLAFIGIRFLIVYFQAIGSLAYTGFGLIISGGVILGSVWIWHKYHSNITGKIRGMIHEK